MNYLQDITNFTDAFSTHAIHYFIAVAAVGTLAMAVVQALKDLTPLRARFQRAAFVAWLHRNRRWSTILRYFRRPPTESHVEREIIRLATCGDRDAFFDLEIEKLCGQLSSAASIVVDFPEQNSEVMETLAAAARGDDVEHVRKVASYSRSAFQTLKDRDPQQYDSAVNARARLMHQIQRNIDAFQIGTGFRWKMVLQLLAASISYLIVMIGIGMQTPQGLERVWIIIKAVPFAILAAVVAPIARDLLAVVTQARSR